MTTQRLVNRSLARLRRSLVEIGAVPFPKDRTPEPEKPEPEPPVLAPTRSQGALVFVLPTGYEESDP